MLQTLFNKDYSESINKNSSKTNEVIKIWKRCNALKVRKFQKKILLIKNTKFFPNFCPSIWKVIEQIKAIIYV